METKNIKREKIAFIILLVTQFLFMVYWGTQKGGYYVDEFFTYDNAHYISASTPDRIKLYDADFLEYDKWFNVSDLKSTLTVNREESLFNDSLKDNILAFINKWPYMAILNYVEAMFFDGELNWWSAISLNIFLLLLNQLLLYKLGKKISGRNDVALLSVALYGFCGMAVSMVVYVRMYIWLTFLTTAFTYLHVLMWESEKHWKKILYEILAFLILYIEFKDSPLPVIYGLAVIGCFSLALLIKKRFVQLAYYIIPIGVGGVGYVALKTDYLNIIMNPKEYVASENGSVAVVSLVSSLLGLTPENFVSRLEDFLHIVCRYMFGHAIVVVLFAACVIIMGILLIKKNGHHKELTDKRSETEIIGKVILCAVIFFALASICFSLGSIRYNSFVFPEISLCIIYFVMLIAERIDKEKIIRVILGLCICLAVFFTCNVPRIENLYPEEKKEIEAIAECKGINSLVVDYYFDDNVMYECLAFADENSKVMFTKVGDTNYDMLDDSILVWQTVSMNFDIQDDLVNAGYSSISPVARTHASTVYICKREVK